MDFGETENKFLPLSRVRNWDIQSHGLSKDEIDIKSDWNSQKFVEKRQDHYEQSCF